MVAGRARARAPARRRGGRVDGVRRLAAPADRRRRGRPRSPARSPGCRHLAGRARRGAVAPGGRGRPDEPPSRAPAQAPARDPAPLRGPRGPGTAGARHRRPGAGGRRRRPQRSRDLRPPRGAPAAGRRRPPRASWPRAPRRSGPSEDVPPQLAGAERPQRATQRARSHVEPHQPRPSSPGRNDRTTRRATQRARSHVEPHHRPSSPGRNDRNERRSELARTSNHPCPDAQAVCQTASALPAGSLKWKRRPPGNSKGSSSTVPPAACTAAYVASRSSL